MNSLRMYVEDAAGGKYLFTCATNREGQENAFRKHASWWIKTGYKHSSIESQPCFPCKIVIEPYQDKTARN